MPADRVKTVCPCCRTQLTVDVATGEILAETRPKSDPDASFDEAMKSVRGGVDRRQDAFDQAFKKTRSLDSVLEKKFEEARKKAKENPDDKPVNPMDLD